MCPGTCSADIIIFISKHMLDFEQHSTASAGVQSRGDKEECWSLLVVVGKSGMPGVVTALRAGWRLQPHDTTARHLPAPLEL